MIKEDKKFFTKNERIEILKLVANNQIKIYESLYNRMIKKYPISEKELINNTTIKLSILRLRFQKLNKLN